MVKLDMQFFYIIINLLILYWLLKKFLFKPITEFMENRKQKIENSISEAEEKLAEAENKNKQYKKMLESANSKADEIIELAKERANKEYNIILAQAKVDAERIVQRGQESIKVEKQKVLKEMRNEIANLAFAVATKIMHRNMDTKSNKEIVEKFLNEEGVA